MFALLLAERGRFLRSAEAPVCGGVCEITTNAGCVLTLRKNPLYRSHFALQRSEKVPASLKDSCLSAEFIRPFFALPPIRDQFAGEIAFGDGENSVNGAEADEDLSLPIFGALNY